MARPLPKIFCQNRAMPFESIQIPANGQGSAKEELNKLLRGGLFVGAFVRTRVAGAQVPSASGVVQPCCHPPAHSHQPKGSQISEATIKPIFLCASAALVRQAKTGFSIDLKCDQHVK